MPAERTPILVVQCAALGHEFLLRNNGSDEIEGLRFRPIRSVFPAVTCAVQASFRTGGPAASHGMVGNGFYSREFARPFFWEQSSALVEGPRIWDTFRASGGTVGVLFWQQCLGTDSDVLLSPAPVHKHHGGMIQDCFSRPAGLYGELLKKLGRPFNLAHYWGPRASVKASSWIVDATIEVMRAPAPDLLLTYLPHLDYELQRTGPDSKGSARSFGEAKALLGKLLAAARERGYKVIVFGDYPIVPVERAVHPNRALLDAGLMSVRDIRGMTYPDLHTSRAFAVVDHQIAHVISKDASDAADATEVLKTLPGVARVLDADGKRDLGIDHPRSGDLVLVAEPDAWFAYPWWRDRKSAPDYATHVDIHNKPGYDPCELLWGRWPLSVSTDASRIQGSHGLAGDEPTATWATDLDLGPDPGSLVDLSRALKRLLDEGGRA